LSADEKTMKLGIIVHCPSPHQKVMLDQLYRVTDTDVIVGYAYANSPNRNWGTPVAAGPTVFVPRVRGLTGGKMLRDWVSSLGRDVWVLNSAFTYHRTQALATAFDQLRLPWVYSGEPPRPRRGPMGWVRNSLLHRLLSRCRGVIATGVEPVRRYRELLGDDRPVTSVPYYIPLDDWLGLPLVSPPAKGEPIRFLTLAQLIQRKGIDVLIEACRRLRPGCWQLDVYGDGPERARLERAVASRGLPVKLHRPLAFASRMAAFRGAHCFGFPSRWDGWGMAPVEALAAGLPVIATDQTMSAHDFIADGSNGWIVPCNVDAISRAMQGVIDHPELLPAISAAARQAVAGYDPSAGAREMVDFCRQIWAASNCTHR
jgi:glycosyltransferase involved in cell wall biosynthesis